MSEKVLVVDDEPHVTQVLKTFLSHANFDVHVAANAMDGLSICSREHPAVVITDYDMPQMNGREFIETLLKDSPTAPRLVIMVTARTESDLRKWAANEAGVGFVEKPVSPRRLVQYIKSRLVEPSAA